MRSKHLYVEGALRRFTTVRKTIGLAIALLLLGLCAAAFLAFQGEITFYTNLFKAYRDGKQFYDNYPYLAQDVAFHPDMSPRLDVYSPPGGARHPVLVFIHGGSWKDYDKELFAPVAMKLLPEEMVVVIPDYSLYPDAGYEQMAREVAAALSWTLDNVQEYGGDPDCVIVAGHSAGGHLAALALMDPRYLADHGRSAADVRGFLGLSGVYDVQAEYDFWQAKGIRPRVIEGVMDGSRNLSQASPTHYVRPGLPPVLLIHGDEDRTVPVEIAIDFHAALQAAGVPVELNIYGGAGHTDYLFATLGGEHASVVDDMVAFVAWLKGQNPGP